MAGLDDGPTSDSATSSSGDDDNGSNDGSDIDAAATSSGKNGAAVSDGGGGGGSDALQQAYRRIGLDSDSDTARPRRKKRAKRRDPHPVEQARHRSTACWYWCGYEMLFFKATPLDHESVRQ